MAEKKKKQSLSQPLATKTAAFKDLGQARPAEEIWLDALISVLEEAGDAVTRSSEDGKLGNPLDDLWIIYG